jgi:proline iminopeptidase
MKKCLLMLLILAAEVAHSQGNVDSFYITTSDSVKLFVKLSGKGFPVLFIHGGPGSNSFYFEKEGGDVFSKDVQLIYLDQRGCGRSSIPASGDYSLGRVVKDFDEVRLWLGFKKWAVMAHSFGGILATEYAHNYQSSVQAMVFLNCTVDLLHTAKAGILKGLEFLGNTKEDRKYFLNDSVPLIKRWGDMFGRLREKGIAYKLMFDDPASKKLDDSLMSLPFLKYDYAQKLWNYPAYFTDHSKQTKDIKVPVLVISGTRDFTIGTDHPSLMHFPRMTLKYIAGGHALYLEHNKELYLAVSPFLKRLSGDKK